MSVPISSLENVTEAKLLKIASNIAQINPDRKASQDKSANIPSDMMSDLVDAFNHYSVLHGVISMVHF